MDKDIILDYVTKTPGNTNRAVLGSMLDSMVHMRTQKVVIFFIYKTTNKTIIADYKVTITDSGATFTETEYEY